MEAEASPPLDEFSSWLLAHAGVNPGAYRSPSILRRVPACLRHLRVSTPDAALLRLQREPTLVPAVLNTLLIGVSGFFRDPAVFSLLEQQVLPELLRARGGKIRVLSAGASTGQELYSVAMLLAEQDAFAGSEFLGIDLRPEAIRRAREGRYEAAELEGLSSERKRRFLTWDPAGGRIGGQLRASVTWQVADALTFAEEGPRDLVLFRNVAIYLERSHADVVWARLTGQLSPGGILVTGRAEEPPSSLGYERVASCIFRSRGP